MGLKKFDKNISYFVSANGLEGLVYKDELRERLYIGMPDVSIRNITEDFLLRISKSEELLTEIKRIRKNYGLANKKDRDTFNEGMNLYKCATEKGKEISSKEYPLANDSFKKFEKIHKDVVELSKQFKLNGEEEIYLLQYITGVDIGDEINLMVETRPFDDYIYLKLHKTLGPKDLQKFWPTIKEYLKNKPQQPKRKSYQLYSKLHYEIYQDHKRGLSSSQLVKKYSKYSLDIDSVNKIISRQKQDILDKK